MARTNGDSIQRRRRTRKIRRTILFGPAAAILASLLFLHTTTTTFAFQSATIADDKRIRHMMRQVHESDGSIVTAAQQQQQEQQPSHFFSRKSLTDFAPPTSKATDHEAASGAAIFDRLCRGAGIERPSKIQSIAWPVLLQSNNNNCNHRAAVLIADQTGSGKTLAYLIPLLQSLITSVAATSKEQQQQSNNTAAAQPRLLILAPTAELADQICAVCQKIQAFPDDNNKQHLFSTVVLTSSGKFATNIRDQIRMLQQKKRRGVDVLISTPGRIATILRTRKAAAEILDLSRLQAVVLDEVDVLLLDETFGPQLQTVGEATNNNAVAVQFVFVTATLPDSVVDQVTGQFPGVQLLKGPGLHRVAPTVTENLVDVSVPSSLNRNPQACFDVKANALQQALRQNRCRRTLIFCNTVTACRQVENLLQRLDRKHKIYNVGSYHNAMTAQARNENLEYFAAAVAAEKSYILVCTDRAARGVDFDAAAVDHVVLFDFPVDPAEYVRRVGRTARAGRTGATTVLAYGWQLPVARSVMGQQQHGNQKRRVKDFTGTAAVNVLDGNGEEENEDTEYLGGVKGRRRQSKKQKNKAVDKNSIGGNIASGKLWGER